MKPGKAPNPNNVTNINKSAHHVGGNTISPSVMALDPPVHVSSYKNALDEWVRIMVFLVKYKLVTEIDTAALALYCVSYGRWQDAEKELQKMREKGSDGLLIKAPSGYPIQNPYLAIANRAMEDCYKYLQQFGLSPSARTRVTLTIQGELFPDAKDAKYFT